MSFDMSSIMGMIGGSGGGGGGMLSGLMGGASGAAGGPWGAIIQKGIDEKSKTARQASSDHANNTIGGFPIGQQQNNQISSPQQGGQQQQKKFKMPITQPSQQSMSQLGGLMQGNTGLSGFNIPGMNNGGMKRYANGGGGFMDMLGGMFGGGSGEGGGDMMQNIGDIASGAMSSVMAGINMVSDQVEGMFNRKEEEKQRNQLAFEQNRATQASSEYAQKNSPYGYQAAEGGKKPSIWQLFLNNNQSYGPTGNYAHGGKSGTIPGDGHPKADNIAIDLEEGAHVAPAEYADRAKSLLASVGVNPNQMYPVKSGGAPDSMISSSEVVISPEHISEIKEKHDMSDADVEATLHPNSPYNQYVKNGGKIYNMMGGNYQNGGTQISSGLQGLNKLGTNFTGEKRDMGKGVGQLFMQVMPQMLPGVGAQKVGGMVQKGIGSMGGYEDKRKGVPASQQKFQPSSDPALMNPNRYTGATVDATGEATDMVPNQGFGAKPAPGTLTPEGQEGSLTKGAMGTKQAPSTAITGSLTSEGQAGSLLKDVDMSVFGMMNGGKKRMYQEGGENLYSDEEHQYADAEFPSIDEIEREIERESDPNYVPPSPYVGGHDLSPKTMPRLPEVDFPTPVFKLEAEKRHSLSGPLRGQRGEDIDKMEKLPMPSGKPIYPSSNQDIRMERVDVPDLSGYYQKEEKPSLMDMLKDPYNQRKLGQLGEMGANALAMAANRAQRPTEVKGTAAPLVSPIRRRYSAIAQAMKADADKSIAGQRSRMRGAGMKEAVSSAVVGPQDVAAKLKIAGAIEGMKGEDQTKTAAMQTQAKSMGAQIKARERATNAMLKERFGARQGEAISKNLAQMGNISDVMSKEAIMQEEMKLGKRESELESLKKQSKALAASGKKTGIYR